TYLASAHYKIVSSKNKIPFSRPKKLEGIKKSFFDSENKLIATFAASLFDEGERMKQNRHLIQLVKEPFVRLQAEEGKKRGLENGDKIKVSSQAFVFEGRVAFDEGVAENTAVLPLGFDQFMVHQPAGLLSGIAVEI